CSKSLDRLAVAVEQPRNKDALGFLQRSRSLGLFFQHLAEPRRERELATLAVFRLAWVEPQPARLQVQMMPLSREQLVRHAPSSDVSRFDGGVVMLWQMLEHGVELVMLEETFAGVVQSQLRYVRLASHFPRSQGQREHPAQGCMFGVDSSARGLLFLSLRHVGRPSVAGYLCCPVVAEEAAKMVDSVLDTVNRAAPVGAIVVCQ